MKSTTQRLRSVGCGLVLTSAVALAGCGAYEPGHAGDPSLAAHNVSAAKTALPAYGTFTGSLAANYYAMATIRAKDGDKIDADYWARKSQAAANGEAVPPERMKVVSEVSASVPEEGAKREPAHATTWNVPGLADPAHSPNVQALQGGRDKYVALLNEGGRDRFPTLAARGQAFYDCWIERSEANIPGDPRFTACKTNFISDATDLNVLLHPPGQRGAFFDYNSATLTAQGKQQIADAVAFIKDGTAKLRITGKADRSGADAYNQKLSERRAQAVKDAAMANGLDASRIVIAWTGETQLPVATKDGVKEARNRVVQIDTMMPVSQVAQLPPQE